MNTRRKTVKAYLDGKYLCDVVRAALDYNKDVSEMKKLIIKSNPNHTVTFKVS